MTRLENLPYKMLSKDKPSTSPNTFLTCCSLEHQEEKNTEERQDLHGWELLAGSQLWGEEKGGRDDQQGPFLCVV